MPNNIENQYLDNKLRWNEITGTMKANAVMWRTISFVCMAITALAVAGMIYASQLPDVVPFLFKEDASGGVTALGIPNRVMKADNPMIANQLSQYIITLRQIPLTNEMRGRYVQKVKVMSTANLFQTQIATSMKNQYAEYQNAERMVEIKTVLPISKDVWEVDWVETKNNVPVGKFRSTITYDRIKQNYKDPLEMLWNPLGIIVRDVNINQVIGS